MSLSPPAPQGTPRRRRPPSPEQTTILQIHIRRARDIPIRRHAEHELAWREARGGPRLQRGERVRARLGGVAACVAERGVWPGVEGCCGEEGGSVLGVEYGVSACQRSEIEIGAEQGARNMGYGDEHEHEHEVMHRRGVQEDVNVQKWSGDTRPR